MKKVMYEGSLLAIIHRSENWSEGLDFLTENEHFVQVGTWYYNKGRELDKHKHNFVRRESDLTQECVFMVSGSMRVDFYNDNMEFICSETLLKGDLGIMISGGHGYEILEDRTKVLEVKNGPFLGVEKDKVRF